MNNQSYNTSSSDVNFLVDYLTRARDIEYSRYSLESLRNKLYGLLQANNEARIDCQNQINDLNRANTQERGPSAVEISFSDFKYEFIGTLIIALVLGFIILSKFDSDDSGVLTAFFLFIFPVVAGIAVVLIHNAIKRNSISNNNNARINDNNSRIYSLQRQTQMLSNKDIPVKEELSRCEANLAQFNGLRAKFYSDGLLPPKYREVIPCATMLEYFENKICFSLIGPDGAISRYEWQVQIKEIVTTLNEISRKVDVVIRNQAQILSAVESIDSKIDNVIDSIRQNTAAIESMNTSVSSGLTGITENTKATALYTEAHAKLAKYVSWREGHSYQSYY